MFKNKLTENCSETPFVKWLDITETWWIWDGINLLARGKYNSIDISFTDYYYTLSSATV